MNNQLSDYIKENLKMVIAICAVGFLLLVLGEVYLYRQQMHLNKMISEGFMQLKEAQEEREAELMQEQVTPSDTMMMEQ